MKPQSVKRTVEPQRLLDERVISRPLHGLRHWNDLAPSAKALGYSHSVPLRGRKEKTFAAKKLEQKEARLTILQESQKLKPGISIH